MSRRWTTAAGALAAAALVTSSAVAVGAGAAPAAAAPALTATASSTAAGSSAAAIADGDVGARDLGAEWRAASGGSSAWVQLDFSAARRVSAVQVFGSSADAFDPKQSTAAALHGVLRFSDGTSVVVSGIAPGAGMPTTVAFPARSTTSVRLELERQIPDAPLALRELTAYDAGATPPRWAPPSASPTRLVKPAAASCSASTRSFAPVLVGRLSLACPTPGSSAGDRATVVVNAPAGSALRAWAAPAGTSGLPVPLRRIAAASAGDDGRAVLTADLRGLPQGPVALKVTGTDSRGEKLSPLYVQLFHGAGRAAAAGTGTRPPSGKTLAYADDFSGPLSVSLFGWDAQYAAAKPEPWGGSQFGEALFADPAWGAGTLATLPGGYLRIRAQDVGELASRQTWGQRHAAGIVSSQRYGGSGFSAQGGYFEARIMGAPGPGAWSAFWLMNSESGTGRSDGTTGEADAVELYGHDTNGACQTNHTWTRAGGDANSGDKLCEQYAMDWAAQWHTYGVQVLPGGKADYYVDGERVTTLDHLGRSDQPFFFMLNLATGGGWPVDLSATGQVSDMYVDWVRVYT